MKERPVFIPPRKRQLAKKTNGPKNYVDHIVSVQSRQKISPTSPALEDALMKTSLLLKNKQPLPQIPKDNNSLNNISTELADDELQNFDCSSFPTREDNLTITPSSYSEISSDTKLNTSQDCLNTRSSKKRVNISSDILQIECESYSPEIRNYENLESIETSLPNEENESLDHYNTRRSNDTYLTMTGTIKRGRKKGQSLDLQINISRDELEKINADALAAEVTKNQNLCFVCTLSTGFHIFILSLLCLPFVTIATSICSFYIGTLTWYNMFTYFNEEKSYLYKLLVSPLLVFAYPLIILICTIGLGLYAGCIQLSMQFNTWINELSDMEKGFYGWLCSFLKLSDCSPYEVVILNDIKLDEQTTTNLSTEELSL